MSLSLGIDVGAVSVKIAALGEKGDQELLSRLQKASATFFLPQLPRTSRLRDSAIALSTYRRVSSNPLGAVSDLIGELCEVVPRNAISAVCLTGSGGQRLARAWKTPFENEFRTLAQGVSTLYPQVRTVFEMGGQTSKYIRLGETDSPDRVVMLDYQSSTECAAGTGSFIDQQASRLLYDVEQVGQAACGATCAARVAGRCSVFAKTDMIHAQQMGYTTEQILRGLCEAVARNFKSSIVKGRRVASPVMLVGGLALNDGVRNALRDTFKLPESDFLVPDLHCWIPAIGAAVLASKENGNCAAVWTHMQDEEALAEKFPTMAPLSLEQVKLLRESVSPVTLPHVNQRVEAYLGIDVGSVSTNLVVIDSSGKLLKEIYVPTAGRPIEVVTAGLHEIAAELGPQIEIRGVGTTGSGRELIGELTGADTINDEITAHKTGATHVCRQLGIAPVDTIFEIGGQDSKFISVRHGVVVDFAMNEACAAGTGSFLEEQAEKLGVSIKGEFARLALSSSGPIALGERCTVFMARDVSNLMLKGAAVSDLCAGLAYSVALNYLNRVVRGRKIGDTIFFQGGTAYNDAVAAAFSVILQKPIIVPPHNGVIGAIGMALIARDRVCSRGEKSKFRGFDLSRVDISSRDFVCRACSNYCEMKEFVIGGEKSYWGDQCSDKFRKRTRTDRQPVIEDLVSLRDELLEVELEKHKETRQTVGIPRTMYFYDRFPFWCTYLQELGYNVTVSPPTDAAIAAHGEELAIAQPCFPVQVAHGHVHALLQQSLDYILLPNIVDAETPFLQEESKLCPWNQTLPFVTRAVEQLENRLNGNLLCPTIHFRQGPSYVRDELRGLARKLGRRKSASDRAAESAYRAQERFRAALQRAGQAALCKLSATEEPAVVLLGRPYNLYDRNVCCDIPRKLRALYGINVVPLDFLPLDLEDISDVNDSMYWNSGRLILAAAQITRRNPRLHLIYISNFKCGPDSFLKSFLDEAGGKPCLVLQFDGHSNDAGYLTRCEAYLDSTGFLRCESSNIAA